MTAGKGTYMDGLSQKGPYYMKGKSRHWFWGALAALLFSAAVRYAMAALIPMLADTMPRGALIGIAALANVLAGAALFAVLLAYGLCNTVKTYRVLFIILACFQAPSAIAGFIGNIGTANAVYRVAGSYTALYIAAGALAGLIAAAWAACLLVVAFARPASGVLRVSAVLLAAYLLLGFIYDLFLLGPVTLALYREVGVEAYSVINMALGLLRNMLTIALHAFLFGAMSFSRHKPPTRSVAA
jgi:hypothetical protein